MEDKTSKKKGRALAQRYERLYTVLLDAIPSSVILIDRTLRIVSANRNFLEKSQRSFDKTIGYQLEEVFPSIIMDQIDIAQSIRQVMEKNESVKGERMTYRAPGLPISIYYYSILPFSWQDRVEGAILLMDDVTEQLRLSDEVRQMERHLGSIVESASEIILSTDKKGALLTWNTAAEKITGYTAADVLGQSFADLCAEENSEDTQNLFSHINKQPQTKEYNLCTRKGTTIPVSWIFSPMKDSHNQTMGIVAVGRDLTERKKFEADMHQAQKLAALGVMAGGIAHEIRNPLAICSSSAQFLLEEESTPEFRRECAEKIHQGLQRASSIIENLLRYSHPSANLQTTLINFLSLIRETHDLVRYHAKVKKIVIKTSFPQKNVMVDGVATLLQQAFINLFLNAINAMPNGGELKIDVKMDQSHVRVQITDNGCGISPLDIGKIFDPFYTTSVVGEGTGLGLSICHSIVKQHKGSIEVESVESQGSVFTVKIPARWGED